MAFDAADRQESTVHAWAAWLTLGLGLAVVCWIGHEAFTSQVITQNPDADFWEHSAVLRALIEDGPGHTAPMVDSPASSPRTTPHFVLIAWGARTLDFDALRAMALAATVNAVLLVLGIWLFFRVLFRDPRASLYGMIVLLASGYQAWSYSNVYQLRHLFSVAAYPSTAAVGLALITMALAIYISRPGGRRPIVRLAGLGLLTAYLLITHPLTATMAGVAIGFLALTAPGISRPLRAGLLMALAAGFVLTFLWPPFSVFEVVVGTGGGGESWVGELGEESGTHRRHGFYDLGGILRTAGLAAVGLLALPAFLRRPRYRFLALSAAALIVPFVVNAFVPLPLGHRFILLALFFLQVGLVWLLLRITPGFRDTPPLPRCRSALGVFIVVVALLAMVVHNFRFANARLQNEARKTTPAERTVVVDYGRRVARLAGADAVVLGDRRVMWPLPTFGVKIVAHLHLNPLVPDGMVRYRDTDRFFAEDATAPQRTKILRRYAVTHVILREGAPVALKAQIEVDSVRSDALPFSLVLFKLR